MVEKIYAVRIAFAVWILIYAMLLIMALDFMSSTIYRMGRFWGVIFSILILMAWFCGLLVVLIRLDVTEDYINTRPISQSEILHIITEFELKIAKLKERIIKNAQKEGRL